VTPSTRVTTAIDRAPGARGGYQLLDPRLAVDYVAARPELAAHLDVAAVADVRELSDGNLNLVFLLRDRHGGGLVLKQALPYVRVDPTWPMTPERASREALALRVHGDLAPDAVPRLYGYDDERHVLALEDLSDHVVWRTALNRGERHEGAAADLGRYVARTAFGSSVLGRDPLAQKALLAAAVNPELCQITEDLVLTEPFIEHEHNTYLPDLADDVRALARDPVVRRRVGGAKVAFMTKAQALLHGDLHTGSVLVRAARDGRPRSTRAFDSEFAFYGPIGFDVGTLWANYLLAAARARALDDRDQADWLLALVDETWSAFERELRHLWPQRHDLRIMDDAVLEDILDEIAVDALVFAAAETARRVVGFAKVSDVESLPEPLRLGAARGALAAARVLAHEPARRPDLGSLAARIADVLESCRNAPALR
jgi:5-methylthioribose kinase